MTLNYKLSKKEINDLITDAFKDDFTPTEIKEIVDALSDGKTINFYPNILFDKRKGIRYEIV